MVYNKTNMGRIFDSPPKDIILVKETPNYFKISNTKIIIYLTTNTTIKSDTQTTHKDSSIPMVIKPKSHRALSPSTRERSKRHPKATQASDITTTNKLMNQTINPNDGINLYPTNTQTVDERGLYPLYNLI